MTIFYYQTDMNEPDWNEIEGVDAADAARNAAARMDKEDNDYPVAAYGGIYKIKIRDESGEIALFKVSGLMVAVYIVDRCVE